MRRNKGFFVTLEGPDGSGKTTQVKLLERYLAGHGYNVVVTREPGGTKISETIRRLLLNPANRLAPLSELFLYEASRAQHVAEIINPALKKGCVVICDRYADATVAYQGWGRALKLDDIRQLNRIACGEAVPDLTILLDVDVKEGLSRAAKKNAGSAPDRLEQENIRFHKRVRAGYLALAKLERKRIKVVRTGSRDVQTIHREIVRIVDKYLKYGF